MKIPKVIWSYWNTAEFPPIIEKCIDSWKVFNPDYTINIITEKTLKKYGLSDLKKLRHSQDSPARFSDHIRLKMLAKYGGIWLDASIVCTQSFDEFFENVGKPSTEFIGFYHPKFTSRKKYPVIESWAFACIKGSKFVKAWKKEFFSLNKHKEVSGYIDYLEDELQVDFQNITKYDDIEYLTIHASAQKVLQYEKYSTKTLVVLDAYKTAFKYRNVENLCKNFKKYCGYPIIKFTGPDREVIKKKKLEKCIFSNVDGLSSSVSSKDAVQNKKPLSFINAQKAMISYLNSKEFASREDAEDSLVSIKKLSKIISKGLITVDSQEGGYDKFMIERAYVFGFMKKKNADATLHALSKGKSPLVFLIIPVIDEKTDKRTERIPLTISRKTGDAATTSSLFINPEDFDHLRKVARINKREKIVYVSCFDPRWGEGSATLYKDLLKAL